MRKLSFLIVFLLVTNACRFKPDYKPVDSPLLHFEPMKDGHKICVIGDGGTGNSKQQRVADALAMEGCDQVRYAGDIIYPNGLKDADDPLFYSNFYDPYKELLENDVPFFLATGNHDFLGNPKAWIEIAKRYDNIHYQNFWYAEMWGDVCFFTLEPALLAIFGQEKWIKNIRKEMEGCKLAIGTSHYPYKSVGQHGDANMFIKRFLKKHVLGKMDVYIAGHDHNLSDEGVVKDTRLLVSGAAGKLRPLRVEPEDGNFAVSEYGWINFIIRRDGEKVWADYEFRVLPKEGEIITTTVRKGTIQAQGIRPYTAEDDEIVILPHPEHQEHEEHEEQPRRHGPRR